LYVKCLVLRQTTLKQFMEAIRRSDVHKVTKLTSKGLDPNFQDVDTGGLWSCVYYVVITVYPLLLKQH